MSVPTFAPFLDPGTGQINPVACLQQAACIDCVYWNQGQILQQIISGLTGNAGSIAALLAYHYQPNSLPPSWALCRNGDDVYLWLAGTTNGYQALAEINSASGSGYFAGTYVNTYFEQQAALIKLAMLDIITDDVSQLRLHIGAHSYGAAVGHRIADEEATSGWGYVDGITFGEPRGVSAGLPASFQCPNWYRVCGDYDLICFIPNIRYKTWINTITLTGFSPSFSYSHYGSRYNLLKEGVLLTTPDPNPNQDFSTDMINSNNVNSHMMGTYTQRLLAEQRSSNRGGVNDRVSQIITAVINGPESQQNVVLSPIDYLTSQNVTATYFSGLLSNLNTAALDTLQTISGSIKATNAFVQKTGSGTAPQGAASGKGGANSSQYAAVGGYTPHRRKKKQ